MPLTNRSKILLLGGLTLATIGLAVAWPKTASAAVPKPKSDPLPTKKPIGGILRRGPNGTVLLRDLPAKCQGYYGAAFQGMGATGCADARAWAEEIDRLVEQYEAGDPFFDESHYDEAETAYDRAASACYLSQASEEAAIAAWVDCLAEIGLTPQEVWAG